MTASEVVYTWIEYPKDITQPCFEGSVSHILLLFCIKQEPSACLEKNQDPCRRFCISEPENQSL